MTSVEMPLDHLNGKSKEDIAKLGRYNLRVFAGQLKLWSNEEEKLAFGTLDNNQQAEEIHRAFTKTKGGAKEATRAPATRTPATRGRKPAAPPPEEEENSPEDEEAPVAPAATRAPATRAQAGTTAAGDGAINLVKAVKENTAQLAALTTVIKENNESLSRLAEICASANIAAHFAAVVGIKIAEETMGVGTQQVLGLLEEDSAQLVLEIQKLSDKMGGMPDDEEEDPDEGNG